MKLHPLGTNDLGISGHIEHSEREPGERVNTMTLAPRPSVCLCFAMLSVCACTLSVVAGPIYVDASATNSPHDGSSWCRAYLDLQQALAVAVAGTEIRVAQGVYRPAPAGGSRDAAFAVPSGVTLIGSFRGCDTPDPDAQDFVVYATVLTGDLDGDDGPDFANRTDNAYHVVTTHNVASGTVLDGLTIQGGQADGPNFGPSVDSRDQGSGLNNYNGQPTLSNCTLRDNYATNHGAFNDHGRATLIDCEFRDNWSGNVGAGLYMHFNTDTTVTGCEFHGNTTAGSGGGAYLKGDSAPSFSDCLFSGNRAILGGGLYFDINNSPTLDNCTFSDNRAVHGGGVYNAQSTTADFTSCNFLRNVVDLDGGAYYVFLGSGSFTDCTFQDNECVADGDTEGSGPAIYSVGSNVSLSRCVVSNNTATDYAGAIAVVNSDVVIDESVLTNNSARKGGALKLQSNSSLFLTRSTFIGNTATAEGGAINLSNLDGVVTIVNCSFLGNSAGTTAGAIHCLISDLLVVNSIFVGNQSGLGGGAAIRCQGASSNEQAPLPATLTLHNCTLTGNTSPDGSSLLFDTFNPDAAGSADVYNSILWDGPNQIRNDGGAAISISHSDVQGGWPGDGTMDLDPLFADADGADNVLGTADDNVRLLAASPVIDNGNAAVVPQDVADLDGDGDSSEPTPLDLAGESRIAGANVDPGAYEVIGEVVTPCQPGTFSMTGEEPCDPCPLGTFQPQEAGTECLACAPGTFAATTGTAHCNPCPEDTFQPDVGKAECVACDCDDGDIFTTDACDAVTGNCRNQEITIPTVSTWSLIYLALLLLCAATIVMPRALGRG